MCSENLLFRNTSIVNCSCLVIGADEGSRSEGRLPRSCFLLSAVKKSYSCGSWILIHNESCHLTKPLSFHCILPYLTTSSQQRLIVYIMTTKAK